MADLPARIGSYEVVRRLGSGGMGTVYLGRDPELGRAVAIKVLRDQIHDQELLDRFFREARSSAALRHPNIITIYASGQHDFQPYMAMEFVDGESLAEVIRHQRPLTLGDKLSYIEQLCAGLHFAHRAGIVHRDIKPANLMIDREGVVRILDFGIARVEGSGMTRDGAMIGTLNYMSPEQMLGRPVDHRSDIFAVGAVAYELLAYQQAFKGGLNDGLLHRLPHEPPPPLKDLCVGISPVLEQIVMRALEKPPERRFTDLAAMRTAIMEVRRQLDTDAMLETIVIRPDAKRPASSRSSGPGSVGSSQDAFGLLNQPRETKDLSVRQRLTDAGVRLDRGDTAGAMRLLREVVALDPANVTASEMLARVQQTASRAGQTIRSDVPRGTSPSDVVLDRTITTPATAPQPRSKARVWALAGAAVAVAMAAASVPWLASWNTDVDTPAQTIDSAAPAAPVGGDSSTVPPATVIAGERATEAPAAIDVQPQPVAQPSAPIAGGAAAPGSTSPATTAAASARGSASNTTPPVNVASAPPPPQPFVTPPPAAAPAAPDTSERDREIGDLLAQVNTMYGGGDTRGALDTLAQNPAALNDARVRDLARRVAEVALVAMRSAEKTALTQKAADVAANTLGLANDAKTRADTFSQKNDYVNAGTQAIIARDLYQQAGSEALARRNQPPAPTAAAPPPAAATSAAAAPPAAPSAAALLAQEQKGMTQALLQFAAAYRDMSVPRLKEIYPTLRRDVEQALPGQWRNCNSFDVKFGEMEFSLGSDGKRATVRVATTYICTPRTGQRPPTRPVEDVFFLVKQGDNWFIDRTSSVD